ncbi:MAG TPA: FAD binding domain-containing protein [Micromonosporaceae bacterium]|jgi:CO/xanthine dehydrogenase FAD-binding subunit
MRLSRPESLEEAVAVLDAAAHPIAYAGGIEVLLGLRSGAIRADVLIDTKRIGGSAGVADSASEIRIGPATRHHDLASDPIVRARLPLLALACAHVGTVRIRMQGTIGGNFATGLAHTDPGAAALVYGGTVTMVGAASRRRVPIDEFWCGGGTVDRKPHELIESIVLRPLDHRWSVVHERIESRHRPPSAVLSCAARIEDDRITLCRLAVGSVGDRPRRLTAVEAVLGGCRPVEAIAAVADHRALIGRAAAAYSDHVGSASYKTDLLVGLIQRALTRIAAMTGEVQR